MGFSGSAYFSRSSTDLKSGTGLLLRTGAFQTMESFAARSVACSILSTGILPVNGFSTPFLRASVSGKATAERMNQPPAAMAMTAITIRMTRSYFPWFFCMAM